MSAVEPVVEGRAMVPAENMAELDTLDAGAREVAITQMLDQARAWLAHAREASAPAREIADFKAFVASAADAARRVKVSKDIQLDADEMVRRSERALGLAVREGQAAGEIGSLTNNNGGATSGYERTRNGKTERIEPAVRQKNGELVSPREFLGTNGAAINDTYAVTDGVSDQQFEEAIAGAKAEGNLSRANVIRRVRAVKNAKADPTEVVERIRELAASGYTSRQIEKAVGLDQEQVAWRVKRFSIDVPADRVVGRTLRHDSNRIIRETVATLEGVAMGIELVDIDTLDQSEIQNWTDSLTASIRALNRLNRQMKEKVQ